jgi:hypothetical protein
LEWFQKQMYIKFSVHDTVIKPQRKYNKMIMVYQTSFRGNSVYIRSAIPRDWSILRVVETTFWWNRKSVVEFSRSPSNCELFSFKSPWICLFIQSPKTNISQNLYTHTIVYQKPQFHLITANVIADLPILSQVS